MENLPRQQNPPLSQLSSSKVTHGKVIFTTNVLATRPTWGSMYSTPRKKRYENILKITKNRWDKAGNVDNGTWKVGNAAQYSCIFINEP
jgi:hypothetical protein